MVAIDPPDHYRKLLDPIPSGVNFATRPVGKTKFVHLFVKERRALENHLRAVRQNLHGAAGSGFTAVIQLITLQLAVAVVN